MTGAHPEDLKWGHLAQRDRLAKDRQGWSICHISSRAGLSPVLASHVRRSHLGSEFASCSDCGSMPVGIGRSVGCLW